MEREILRKLGFKMMRAVEQARLTKQFRQSSDSPGVQPQAGKGTEPLSPAEGLSTPGSGGQRSQDEHRNETTGPKPQPLPSVKETGGSKPEASSHEVVGQAKVSAEPISPLQAKPAAIERVSTNNTNTSAKPPVPVPQANSVKSPPSTEAARLRAVALPPGQSVKGYTMEEARALGLL
jgi:hypothetical protein